MKTTPRTLLSRLALCAALGACAALPARAGDPTAPAPTTTLECMLAAHNGESNAHARYLAFAEKADAEGYTQVASLFRAAARAEQVHADEHARVIARLGGSAEAKIETPDVKSTRENLEAALQGERYERDTMYPEFLRIARTEGQKEAVRALNFAKTAENEHAKFYAEALADLESWKGGTRTFYVCTVCGYTALALPENKCVSCFQPKEKYVKVV